MWIEVFLWTLNNFLFVLLWVRHWISTLLFMANKHHKVLLFKKSMSCKCSHTNQSWWNCVFEVKRRYCKCLCFFLMCILQTKLSNGGAVIISHTKIPHWNWTFHFSIYPNICLWDWFNSSEIQLSLYLQHHKLTHLPYIIHPVHRTYTSHAHPLLITNPLQVRLSTAFLL